VLNELKQFGLKIRGFNYVVEKVVIKHNDQLVRTILIISGCIILLLIIVVMGILIWKNHQLSKANQQLYARNMDVLAAADEEKRLKARYEGELAAIKELIQNGVAGEAVKQKYQNSTLDDDDKNMLQDRIMNLFENTDEIFAEDFNMNKLATLVGSNYKNVSQVINELMGKNFNALLNEYRIQEACRRFNDIANYGHYTIEAIGNSVGYGSRSTFVTQFKMITGLTPSEFQNMARQIR
jgi:AraC-like DNA-binding protein